MEEHDIGKENTMFGYSGMLGSNAMRHEIILTLYGLVLHKIVVWIMTRNYNLYLSI